MGNKIVWGLVVGNIPCEQTQGDCFLGINLNNHLLIRCLLSNTCGSAGYGELGAAEGNSLRVWDKV